jgi:hypothetical protein
MIGQPKVWKGIALAAALLFVCFVWPTPYRYTDHVTRWNIFTGGVQTFNRERGWESNKQRDKANLAEMTALMEARKAALQKYRIEASERAKNAFKTGLDTLSQEERNRLVTSCTAALNGDEPPAVVQETGRIIWDDEITPPAGFTLQPSSMVSMIKRCAALEVKP